MAKNANNIEKALKVYELVEKNYEPGRQDRCRLWVYRSMIRKEYPMSERTFWRMLALAKYEKDKLQKIKNNEHKLDFRQGRLFD
jgi:hypothetical protein